MKLLFLDVETGGMDEINQSLLTIGLVLWENGIIVDTLELFISKDKYDYVDASIKFNKIDLDELRKKGISEEEVIIRINDFCNKYFGNEKALIAGHNVAFDIGFMKALYRRNNQDFYSRFGYRFIDTGTILRFLYMQGKFEKDISASDKAFEYFNIRFKEGTRHSALADSEATASLYTKLLEIK